MRKGKKNKMNNKEAIDVLEIAIKNLKTKDESVTNGDMITATFPYTSINYYITSVEVKLEHHGQYDTGLLFDKGWWNAPYKRGEQK